MCHHTEQLGDIWMRHKLYHVSILGKFCTLTLMYYEKNKGKKIFQLDTGVGGREPGTVAQFRISNVNHPSITLIPWPLIGDWIQLTPPPSLTLTFNMVRTLPQPPSLTFVLYTFSPLVKTSNDSFVQWYIPRPCQYRHTHYSKGAAKENWRGQDIQEFDNKE